MRFKEYIIKRYSTILFFLGGSMILFGLLFFAPLILMLFYPEELHLSYIYLSPAFISIFFGLCIRRFLKNKISSKSLNSTEGGTLVVIIWIYASLIGSVPFLLNGGNGFIHALFESVSGWTTTGLSVIDVTVTPFTLLFWRSLTQFVGGLGFVIVMISFLLMPGLPVSFSAEGREKDIVPHLRNSTIIMTKIYLFYFLLGSILYYVTGMPLFHAINHCMAAISTGGFSTKPNSINSFDSFPIEVVSIFLMIIGQLNFTTHYLLVKSEWKTAVKSLEVKTSCIVIIIAVILIIFITTIPLYSGNAQINENSSNFFTVLMAKYQFSIRTGIFDTISAITTTGFNASPSFNEWNSFGILLLIFLMFMGGQTNSTAGGIKQYRIALMFKAIYWQIKKILLPSSAVSSNYLIVNDKKVFIKNEILVNVFLFMCIYFVFFIVGGLIYTAHGFPVPDSLFECASTLSTVGISMGITGHDTPIGILCFQIIGMLMGRLEFFVIFVAIHKIIDDVIAYYKDKQ